MHSFELSQDCTRSAPVATRGLFQKIKEKLQRDEHMPLRILLPKIYNYIKTMILAKVYLRACTSVGPRARTRFKPHIENAGRMYFGRDFHVSSMFVPTHFVTGHSGTLTFGDEVSINFGVGISAHENITIGNRVRMGPYCMVMDTDYHGVHDRNAKDTQPVIIEDDVWLAGRVTVLKGAHIGKGSLITAGSVVRGKIPAYVIAGGIPARVLKSIYAPPSKVPGTSLEESRASLDLAIPVTYREIHKTHKLHTSNTEVVYDSDIQNISQPLADIVCGVVKKIFSVNNDVTLTTQSRDVLKWDSLGQLNLTLALEEHFNIRFSEEDMLQMNSVFDVCAIVQRRLGTSLN